MSGHDNGMNSETLPPTASDGSVDVLSAPDYPPPPEPGREGGSRMAPRLVIAIVVLLAVAGATVAVLLATGSKTHHHTATVTHVPVDPVLTASEVAAARKTGILMVVTHSADSTPLTALNSGNTLLGSGSAVVVDAQRGLLLTAGHVVADAENIQVGLDAHDLVSATLVDFDPKHDLAVLRIAQGSIPGLQSVPLADPASVGPGKTAYVLGFRGDASGTSFLDNKLQFSSGTVAATGTRIDINADALGINNPNAGQLLTNLIETNAPIGPGDSGGAAVDDHGRLIGIAEAGNSSAQGVAFATSINTIDSVLPALEHGHVPWTGIGVSAMPPGPVDKSGGQGGQLVLSVDANSPAGQNGFGGLLKDATQAGYWVVIYAINGREVSTAQEWTDAVGQLQSGETFQASVVVLDSNWHPVGGEKRSLTMP